MPRQYPAIVVMGGQFGWEGKGLVCQHVAEELDILMGGGIFTCVRVGDPTEPHVASGNDWTIPLRQIPTPFSVRAAQLYIGPGSVVDPTALKDDLGAVQAIESSLSSEENQVDFGVMKRLKVDPRALLLDGDDGKARVKDEARAGIQSEYGFWSDGHGAVRAQSLLRKAQRIGDLEKVEKRQIPEVRTKNLDGVLRYGGTGDPVGPATPEPLYYEGPVLIESSHGYGMSHNVSGAYPYVCHEDVTPGAILSAAGISSRARHHVIMVMRTFPVRNPGNSGPMFDEREWADLHKGNTAIPKSGELAIGFKKPLRVGRFDPVLARAAGRACKPDSLVLTGLQYQFKGLAKAKGWKDVRALPEAIGFIREVEILVEAPVAAVTVGTDQLILNPDVKLFDDAWVDDPEKEEEDDDTES